MNTTINATIPLFCLMVALTSCAIEPKNETSTLKGFNNKGIILNDGQNEEINGFLAPDAVTYIFVRHGEKDLSVKDNPPLTEEGKSRAKKIANLVKDLPIYRVCYTNNMKRTAQTAEPTIQQFQCQTDQFSKTAVLPFFLSTLQAYKGRCLLVVGNTNTIPMMLNALKTNRHYEDIDEKEYDNIFIVTARSTEDATIRQLKY